MNNGGIAYINGEYLPRDEVRISPDDRGFLFADGIYEVARWYEGLFYDMDGHLSRLRRSLGELAIIWEESYSFPSIARELIRLNHLEGSQALVYIEVTRGAAKRSHAFPSPAIKPTVYGFATDFVPENRGKESGIKVMLKEDIRWSRCDIKSIALLPNVLSFQEAVSKGFAECAFVRNANITECSHSNIFFVKSGILYTHPESAYVLAGITRKNIIRIARQERIEVKEEPVSLRMLGDLSEAFISNTSGEVTPVVTLDDKVIGNGKPGPMANFIRGRFNDEISTLKHS
ncbi:MAG: aminotransferase class IV [Bacteroidales bacterium]